MAELPDYYGDLGVKPSAGRQEIERIYRQRVAELRASTVEDAPEELAEVEAAYVILGDQAKRAEYDRKLERADEAADTAEMNAYLRSHHHRKTTKGSSGWLDAIGAILKLFK